MENSSKTDITLPYLTNATNIEKFIQGVIRKPGNDSGIKTIFGEGKYIETKRALEILGIVENLELTDLGRSITYESDPEKKSSLWATAVINYEPYAAFLHYLQANFKSEEISMDVVKNFWARNNYGTSNNNRDDALASFGHLLGLSDIGKFVVGRHNKPSRVIIPKKNLDLVLSNVIEHQSTETTPSLATPSNSVSYGNASSLNNNTDDTVDNNETIFSNPKALVAPPCVNLTIDMSSWEQDKITHFFRCLYGKFND